MKKILFLLIVILVQQLNAQTPDVFTRKASSISSGVNTVIANLNGSVNANGTDCSVYFEYGTTTAYGNTVSATPATVNGSSNVTVSASVTLTSSRYTIHYRLKVTNDGGTFYGRDFMATAVDPVRKVDIIPSCNDIPDEAIFGLLNSNVFTPSIYWDDGTNHGTESFISNTETIYVSKYATVSFSYNSSLFQQRLTDHQRCDEESSAWNRVFVYNLGGLDENAQLYKIINKNYYPVSILAAAAYSYTIPEQSSAFFVSGSMDPVIFRTNGEDFIDLESRFFRYEEIGWLDVKSISSTTATATFEVYNRDDVAHTFVFRNSAGTENTYALGGYQSTSITLSNEVWSVYVTVNDANPSNYYDFNTIQYTTGVTFGSPAYAVNGRLKIATATPVAAVPLTPLLTSLTANSATSFTVNGIISGNPSQSETVDYFFVYGTDPDNLNQSTTPQQITIPANQDASVSTTLNGLSSETLYYSKLVVGSTQSNRKEIFLSSLPSANLKIRLRADSKVTASGSLVSNWGDLSGNENNAAQSTGANQPTLVSNSINGNPVIRFNGTNSKLTLPASTTLGIQSNPYEMFIVAKSSSSNVQFLVSGGATEQFEYHLNGDAGARFIPTTLTYLDLGAAGSYTDGNPHLFSARASSSGGAVRVDGTDGGTSSADILSSNSGALQLGVRSDGTYYFNGDIAEVILYNTNLSTSDRSTVEHYLANRYGITSGALPVELTSFSAHVIDGKVLLNWQTATEVNNYGFEVERSNVETRHSASGGSSLQWEKVSFVQGHGNSNSPKSYAFTDATPSNGKVQYRLKQIDFDGKYEYSKAVEVKAETPTQFKLAQNYPNPFNPETVISYELPVNGKVELRVYDLLGREVAELVNEEKVAGRYDVKFSVKDEGSNFASGVYLYRLSANSFTAAKKFILIK